MAKYIIRDAEGEYINTIVAGQEFVEAHYPGAWELVIEPEPEPTTEIPLSVMISGTARRQRQFLKLAATDPIAALLMEKLNEYKNWV